MFGIGAYNNNTDMKRSRSKDDNFPFPFLGKNKLKPKRKFCPVIRPSDLHSNLVQFLSGLLSCDVTLEPSSSGPYLSFPEINDSTREAMRSRLSITDNDVDIDYYLCGLCEPICVEQCQAVVHGKSASLADWAVLSPMQQLEAAMASVDRADIGGLAPWMLPEEHSWNASVKLWTSLQGCKTLKDVCKDLTSLKLENLLVGHSNFLGAELLKQQDVPLVIPIYVVNYLQDEMRHELHVLGAILSSVGALTIVDPNGVVPEHFGEPNAVMIELPWKKN